MRGLPVLLVVAAFVASCSDDDGDSAAPTTTTSAAAATATAELVPSTCPFDPPETDHWECSTMIVPADRGEPDAGHVLIPVAVLRTQASNPLPDPIVYFNGGPGDDTLSGWAGFFGEYAADGRRDLILFDQRGTGGARPSLNCPEAEQVVRENLAAADDISVEIAREDDAARACHARLVDAGIDLDDFDTTTTADDADDLRRALGVESWNVIGISYGTTVALEVARRHPDTVRSMVVDSVFPPDLEPGGTRVLRAASRAFDAYFDACTASPACAASHPDLRREFNELAASWDAQPFETDVDDPNGSDTKLHVRLQGNELTGGFHQALYSADLLPALPSVLSQIRPRGDSARALVGTFVVDALNQTLHSAEGIGSVVNCADRQAVEPAPTDVAALTANTPSLRTFVEGPASDCPLWDVASVSDEFNSVPPSKVRALALAGEFDPITPPDDTERTAAKFAGSTYVLFPGLGHGELVSHDCPKAIVKAFIDDPTATPDQSCVAAMGPPDFAPG